MWKSINSSSLDQSNFCISSSLSGRRTERRSRLSGRPSWRLSWRLSGLPRRFPLRLPRRRPTDLPSLRSAGYSGQFVTIASNIKTSESRATICSRQSRLFVIGPQPDLPAQIETEKVRPSEVGGPRWLSLAVAGRRRNAKQSNHAPQNDRSDDACCLLANSLASQGPTWPALPGAGRSACRGGPKQTFRHQYSCFSIGELKK